MVAYICILAESGFTIEIVVQGWLNLVEQSINVIGCGENAVESVRMNVLFGRMWYNVVLWVVDCGRQQCGRQQCG